MYDAFMRDASDHSLTASSRVRAAFDALYTACVQLVDPQDMSADSGEKFAESLVAHALAAMNLPGEYAALAGKLCDWALHTAPLPPLPMSPIEAVALAERVHEAAQEKGAC
ncbi:hypothetical protein AWB68_06501 [Caballeronia choica]|uniref:Uncharacterized protein n=1 Tax=Caballeronia choica TaxID=326476 RepID=A0A158KNU3_9BURK|nr:hypothetical protein [Caballeronia choica]SAL82393.1 hypothetical protein AWB68_06501 [Caballeronia choica]